MTFDEWVDSYADKNIAFGWYSEKAFTYAMRQAWEAGREEGRREALEEAVKAVQQAVGYNLGASGRIRALSKGDAL